MSRGQSQLALLFLASVTAALGGCVRTVTQAELESSVVGTQGNTFPGVLVHERSTAAFDYYRIETQLGVHSRYRVRRRPTQ